MLFFFFPSLCSFFSSPRASDVTEHQSQKQRQQNSPNVNSALVQRSLSSFYVEAERGLCVIFKVMASCCFSISYLQHTEPYQMQTGVMGHLLDHKAQSIIRFGICHAGWQFVVFEISFLTWVDFIIATPINHFERNINEL